MNYEKIWQKVLSDGEKIEYSFSVSPKYIKTSLIFWGVISFLFLFLYGIGILFFLTALFYYYFYLPRANVYAFTNKRILIHRGLFSTNVISVDYHKITDVSVSEPYFSRIIFHSGSISINTAGTGSAEVTLKHIPSPYELKKKLDSLKDEQ